MSLFLSIPSDLPMSESSPQTAYPESAPQEPSENRFSLYLGFSHGYNVDLIYKTQITETFSHD